MEVTFELSPGITVKRFLFLEKMDQWHVLLYKGYEYLRLLVCANPQVADDPAGCAAAHAGFVLRYARTLC